MTVALLIKPWWVRWLISSVQCTIVIALWILLAPHAIDRWSWVWGPPLVLACAVGLATAIEPFRRPIERPYWQAVASVGTSDERSRAVRAVDRGGVPSEPAVLAAAVRFGGVWEAQHRRRQESWTVRQPWAYPIVLAGVAAIEFAVGNVRLGIAMVLFAGWWAGSGWWNRRTAARVTANLAALRAAAAGDPSLEVTPPASPRPRRGFVPMALLVVVVAAMVALWYLTPPQVWN